MLLVEVSARFGKAENRIFLSVPQGTREFFVRGQEHDRTLVAVVVKPAKARQARSEIASSHPKFGINFQRSSPDLQRFNRAAEVAEQVSKIG